MDISSLALRTSLDMRQLFSSITTQKYAFHWDWIKLTGNFHFHQTETRLATGTVSQEKTLQIWQNSGWEETNRYLLKNSQKVLMFNKSTTSFSRSLFPWLSIPQNRPCSDHSIGIYSYSDLHIPWPRYKNNEITVISQKISSIFIVSVDLSLKIGVWACTFPIFKSWLILKNPIRLFFKLVGEVV